MKLREKIVLCISLVIGISSISIGIASTALDCDACKKVDETKWRIVANKHYKVCDKGHSHYLADHSFDEYGECVCGERDEFYAKRISKTCNQCGVELTKNWKYVGGNLHYQECSNGHKNDLGVHEWTHADIAIRSQQSVWEDNECKICKLRIPAYPPVAYLVDNVNLNCLGCGEVIGAQWYKTDNGMHYRACPNNHHSFIGVHVFIDGICSSCKIKESDLGEKERELLNKKESEKETTKQETTNQGTTNQGTTNQGTTNQGTVNQGTTNQGTTNQVTTNQVTTNQATPSAITSNILVCNKCGKGCIWNTTETMHVGFCSENKTHIALIEDHVFDNKKCVKCGYIEKRNYASKFADFTDENHWAWRNVCALQDNGIVKGAVDYTTGKLNLYADEKITAEAFIALVARILGYNTEDKISKDEVYTPIITDWSEGEWKYLMKYLGNNAEEIIKTALASDELEVDDKIIATNYKKYITREKAAYLLGNLLDSTTYTQLGQEAMESVQKFEDWDKVTENYSKQLALLTYYDILRGNLTNGKLYVDPQETLTRVQAIAFLDRYYSIKNLAI